MNRKHVKVPNEIVQQQMAQHEAAQAQFRERVKRASKGAAGQGHCSFPKQSPSTPSTDLHGPVSQPYQLQNLQDHSHIDSSSNNDSSDDDSDIFPASMAGRVPRASIDVPANVGHKLIVLPPSILENKRPSLTNLGEQALQASQSMIEQVAGGPSATSKRAPVCSTSQQHSSDSLQWVAAHARLRMGLQPPAGIDLKVDVPDPVLPVTAEEEEEELQKLPTGSKVANMILYGPEEKPRPSPNRSTSQLPLSQKGLLERLEQRFSPTGHLHLEIQQSRTSPSGLLRPSSSISPWGPSSPNGPRGALSPHGPPGPSSLNSPWGPLSPNELRGTSSPNGVRSPFSSNSPWGPSSPNGSRSLSSANGSRNLSFAHTSRSLSSSHGSKTLAPPNCLRSPTPQALNPTASGKGRFSNIQASPGRPGRPAVHESMPGHGQDAGSEKDLSGPLPSPSCIQALGLCTGPSRPVGILTSPPLSGQSSLQSSASGGVLGGGSLSHSLKHQSTLARHSSKDMKLQITNAMSDVLQDA